MSAPPSTGRFETGLRSDAGTLPRSISGAAASSYLTCSLRFYFERVACIHKPVSRRRHLGKAVQVALTAFHRARLQGGDESPEAIAVVFEKAFASIEGGEGPVDFGDEVDRNACRKSGLRMIGAFLDSSGVSNDRPRGVEVRMTEELPGLSVPLTGTVNLIDTDRSLVDFQFVETMPEWEVVRCDCEIQLVSNQLLMESANGKIPSSLDLVFLVQTKIPQVIRMKLPPVDEQRKRRVTALLEIAVIGIMSDRFHPQPGMQCSWCRFRQECFAWEQNTYKQRRVA